MWAFSYPKFKEITMTIIIVILLFLILCGVAPDLAAGLINLIVALAVIGFVLGLVGLGAVLLLT
jgi:hypothetical protein